MELCTEGSLHNILEHPENGHGLNEADFFDVLRDVGESRDNFAIKHSYHS